MICVLNSFCVSMIVFYFSGRCSDETFGPVVTMMCWLIQIQFWQVVLHSLYQCGRSVVCIRTCIHVCPMHTSCVHGYICALCSCTCIHPCPMHKYMHTSVYVSTQKMRAVESQNADVKYLLCFGLRMRTLGGGDQQGKHDGQNQNIKQLRSHRNFPGKIEQVCMNSYTYPCLRICMYRCTYTSMHMYVQFMYIYIYIYIYIWYW